jgi:transposase
MALQHHGLTSTQIAQRMGISARTVRYWIQRGYGPHAQRRRKRRSPFDRFAPYLARRWQDGCHDVSQLWDEVRAQGYPNSLRTFYRYIQTLRQQNQLVLPDPSPVESLTTRDALWLIVRSPEALPEQEQAQLEALKQGSAPFAHLYRLVQSFGEMVWRRQGQRLETWQSEVYASDFPELKCFAKGLDRDKAAVVAGLTERYSNGMVEGFVNKVKMVKRVMFGKAGFPLLRQRVLHAL